MAGLNEKVVLITGAGSGIGRESALRMAREGAAVMCAYIDQERTQPYSAMESACEDLDSRTIREANESGR